MRPFFVHFSERCCILWYNEDRIKCTGGEWILQTITIVSAAILKGDRVLVREQCENTEQSLWEFPGGPVEEGEQPVSALFRIIRKELAAEVQVDRPLLQVTDSEPEGRVIRECYLCTAPADQLKQLEQENTRWLTFRDLDHMEWKEADRRIAEAVKQFFKQAERML